MKFPAQVTRFQAGSMPSLRERGRYGHLWGGAVRPHAPCVGPHVPIQEALVILRRRHRGNSDAVAETQTLTKTVEGDDEAKHLFKQAPPVIPVTDSQ